MRFIKHTKFAFFISGLLTLSLVCLIIFRMTTGQHTEINQQKALLQKMYSLFDGFKTQPLTTKEFTQLIQIRSDQNIKSLPDEQREKLFICLSQFYKCYTTGDFNAYKQFRLHKPFSIGEKVTFFFKKEAMSKGIKLNSNEEILQYGWNLENGENRISQVNTSRISLIFTKRRDNGEELKLHPESKNWPEFGAAQCWDSQITYFPSLDEILKKAISIQFFSLHFLARCEFNTNWPATPFTFVGYWDPITKDWMPYAFCHMSPNSLYNTMF